MLMRLKNEESGWVMVFFAIFLPVVLLVVALMVEYGHLSLAKNEAQSAVDAAALSAVAGIPNYRSSNGSMTKVRRLAEMFNVQGSHDDANLVNKGDAAISADNDTQMVTYVPTSGAIVPPANPAAANGVRITKTYDIPAFLRSFGDSKSVTASATAVLLSPKCFPVRVPLLLMRNSCGQANPPSNNCGEVSCNQTFTSAITSPSPNDNAAFFTKFGIPSSAISCVRTVNGTNPAPVICQDDRVNMNNGVLGSCMHEIKNECDRRTCSPNNPWIVVVPTIDCSDLGPGSNFTRDAPVRGFAAIGITAVNSHGSPKTISFQLLCGISIAGGSPGGNSYCGLYTPPTLIQ